ncbi:hypothetical protein O9929_13140 [Vibrio lentus]|nr:hypothetical protein [Vibrio lentus]
MYLPNKHYSMADVAQHLGYAGKVRNLFELSNEPMASRRTSWKKLELIEAASLHFLTVFHLQILEGHQMMALLSSVISYLATRVIILPGI